jgi:hypothetical protein
MEEGDGNMCRVTAGSCLSARFAAASSTQILLAADPFRRRRSGLGLGLVVRDIFAISFLQSDQLYGRVDCEYEND